ncbi:unnamed protein product [Gongylonema pulchrum]|uniref:Secreted protein n=1 Tax=Gongylonema pulchrum TaxID=637853 RepID=A0A183DKY3_9BILA|nr:unnamed protein product [Gongylonema pulchrum]
MFVAIILNHSFYSLVIVSARSRMFEPPFISDFDFGTDFGSSAQNPFSLRTRLREVRDAFRGIRVIIVYFLNKLCIFSCVCNDILRKK